MELQFVPASHEVMVSNLPLRVLSGCAPAARQIRIPFAIAFRSFPVVLRFLLFLFLQPVSLLFLLGLPSKPWVAKSPLSSGATQVHLPAYSFSDQITKDVQECTVDYTKVHIL